MDGADIRTLRKRLGWTQEKLAERLGVSFVSVNRWEAGKTQPSKGNQAALKALNESAHPASSPSWLTSAQTLRPIQYLGSKLRLTGLIGERVSQFVPPEGVVCDLFSGSGVVTHALAQRYTVIAVDIQKYSTTLASALLNPSRPDESEISALIAEARSSETLTRLAAAFSPLIELEKTYIKDAARGAPEKLASLVETGSSYLYQEDQPDDLPSAIKYAHSKTSTNLRALPNRVRNTALITSYYGGVYFSYQQAISLDALRTVICNHYPEGRTRDYLIAILLSTASHITSTVGKQFAQPVRLQKRDGAFREILVSRTVRDRTYDAIDLFIDWSKKFSESSRPIEAGHQAYTADYTQFLGQYTGQIDCVYADPPYTIDHYSRFYHVLESIARYDFPTLSKMRKAGRIQTMRGLYRDDRHQSKFCIASTVEAAFRELFDAVKTRDVPLVLSYSPQSQDKNGRPRLLGLPTLQDLASEYFGDVQPTSPDPHHHRKLNSANRNAMPNHGGEALLICRN